MNVDDNKEDASHDKILRFLRRHFKMVLSINSCFSTPNASVMHYAVGDTRPTKLYFGTRKSFEKYKLLKDDGRVSCIILEEGVNPEYVVSMHGTAKEITSGIEQDFARSMFKASNNTAWYIEGQEDVIMFVIDITSMKVLDGTSGKLIVNNIEI